MGVAGAIRRDWSMIEGPKPAMATLTMNTAVPT